VSAPPPASPATLRVERLASRHDRAAFSCGIPELDDYLCRQAGQDQRRKVAACYVATEPATPSRILGYYTLSSYGVRLIDLPMDIRRRLPKYPTVPAALIGRLAVNVEARGRRVGESLLLDALRRTLRLADELAIHAIVVDAKTADASAFYARYGFQAFPSEPLRLFMALATVVQLFKEG